MLYSIIPNEVVFDEEDTTKQKKVEFKIGDMLIEASRIDDGKYKVDRLISSSPSDFLDSKIKPDTVIEIKLE